MRNNLTLFLLSLLILSSSAISAQVKLLPLFSDDMILQQQTEAPIWGMSKPNKKIDITTSWNNKKYTTKSDATGKWSIKVETIKAGGPYTITISDGKPVVLKNVLLGEVWLCSGQSNMEMQVDGWGKVNNYQEELKNSNYPNIRLLQVEKATSTLPITDLKVEKGKWQVCDAESVADFSAVGYFFGRDIHLAENTPIGLINTSWGGTIAETWTSGETLEAMPSFTKAVDEVRNMPKSEEEQNKIFLNKLEDWKQEIVKKDLGFDGGKPHWAMLNTDSKDWGTVSLPGMIQKKNIGLEGFNGVVWFRKEVNIPSTWNGKNITLNLGAIDDNDFTYFNGEEVGHTEGWMSQRSYTISSKMVKNGKAVIAVRLMDTGGDGGFYGGDENMYLQMGAEKISLAGDWQYKVSLNIRDVPSMPRNTVGEPNIPTFLYNAMINPLVPFSIKGAIWYQGEGNTGQSYQYRELFPLMITDWRKQWNSNFPFYFVQLANFTSEQTKPVESTWAELREAQLRTLNLANTGMAVTIDIGEPHDIHPKNKQDVGKRLALAARANTYGEKITYSGPIYESHKIEGNKIRIFFKHTDGGLKAKNGGELKGFTIAGLDHKFHWADAVIDGNSILVSSDLVQYPQAVRYAWADNPICNLYNGGNLPASPFRTDDWQGITYYAQ